jgi:hypothetical protein
MENRSSLLTEILAQFKLANGVLTASQVADALGKESGVVSGMLDTLVKMGRLKELDHADCDLCPLRAACSLADAHTRCYSLKS